MSGVQLKHQKANREVNGCENRKDVDRALTVSYVRKNRYEFISHNSYQRGDKMRAKVAERGQVTIPKPLRDRLGIRPGTVLEFREDEGRLVAVKVETLDPVDQAYGKLGRGRRTEEIMRQLRGD